MSTDTRARWTQIVAPVVAKRTNLCADCGAIVVARASARYPAGNHVAKRCDSCARARRADKEKTRKRSRIVEMPLRTGECIDCGTTVTATRSERYPNGHRPPHRCDECNRRRLRFMKRRWRAEHLERYTDIVRRGLARRGANYERPNARTDENGRRLCETCAVPLTRKRRPNGTLGSWPVLCPSCRVVRRREEQRLQWARRKQLTLENGGVAPLPAVHGKYGTYCGWACRCEPCTAAARVEWRRKDRRRSERRRAV